MERNMRHQKVITYDLDTDTVSTSATNFLRLLRKTKYHVHVLVDYSGGINTYPRIVGVYKEREAAETKKARLVGNSTWANDYYAILRFRIKGE
jgi:hypothetical protein